jgi:hypothetical protein
MWGLEVSVRFEGHSAGVPQIPAEETTTSRRKTRRNDSRARYNRLSDTIS